MLMWLSVRLTLWYGRMCPRFLAPHFLVRSQGLVGVLWGQQGSRWIVDPKLPLGVNLCHVMDWCPIQRMGYQKESKARHSNCTQTNKEVQVSVLNVNHF